MTATGIQTREIETDLVLLPNPWPPGCLVETEYPTEKGRTCHDQGQETHMFLQDMIVGGVVTVVTGIEAGIAVATMTEVDVIGRATVKGTEGGMQWTVTDDHRTEDLPEGKIAQIFPSY